MGTVVFSVLKKGDAGGWGGGGAGNLPSAEKREHRQEKGRYSVMSSPTTAYAWLPVDSNFKM